MRKLAMTFSLGFLLFILEGFLGGNPLWAVTPKIAAGGYHTLVLKLDGTLWAWGDNFSGQLGDGTNTDRITPAPVPGGVNTWAAVAAGYTHTVALKSDGTLWAWGDNFSGQLGDGTSGPGTNKNTPVPVFGGVNTWMAVAAGYTHTVALKLDGTLWAWGDNDYGQLGDNTNTDSNKPVPVFGGVNTWVAVAAAGFHTVALKGDGTLWAWGSNSNGQLGDNTKINKNIPVQVFGGGNTWGTIASGVYHTVALKGDGTLWAWGYNNCGQLGDGTKTDSTVPVQVSGGGNTWEAIVAGGFHTVARKSDVTLWAWGLNSNGQLGDNTSTDSTTPVQVSGGANTWVAIAAGYNHNVAVKSIESLWTWGWNLYGQLGDGTYTDRNAPKMIDPKGIIDFDGDGKTDIVWRHKTDGWNAVWLMDGAIYVGSMWLPGVADTNWEIVGMGDFSGDGRTDIFWRNKANGLNTVWLMDGTTYLSSSWFPTVSDTDWKIVGMGDFSGDGKTDIFWRNKTTGWNTLWLMDGTTYLSSAWFPTVSDIDWEIVAMGDFSGDGKTDIFWRNKTTGWNTLWLMDGATYVDSAWFPTVSDIDWEIVGTADFSGDKKTDIVWRNKQTGDNLLWLMDGVTYMGSTWLPGVADTNWEIIGP